MLNLTSNILVLLVAILHLVFLTLEIFLWTKPLAAEHSALHLNLPRRPELLPPIRDFTMVSGCGLIWSLFLGATGMSQNILSPLRNRCRYLWRIHGQPKNSLDTALPGVIALVFVLLSR